MTTRQAWIDKGDVVSVVQQCILAGVCRSTIYAQQMPKPVDDRDLLFRKLIDENYTHCPFFGNRNMVVFLKTADHDVTITESKA